jgi:tetratricopeptide (TPR) repeat protein
MMPMNCPKCGRGNEDDAVICGACDYILDTRFLGDDILDERLGDDEGPTLGGDAVILGDLDGEYDSFLSEETGGFLTAATAEMARVVLPAETYIDAPTRALLEPAAVPSLAPDVNLTDPAFSPIERAVASHVDGVRPLARITHLAGLGEADVRIAIAMLAEKGALKLAGRAESADVISIESAGNVTDEGLDDFDEKTHYDDELPRKIEARAEALVTVVNPAPSSAFSSEFESPADTIVERSGAAGYADLVGLRTREAANEAPISSDAAKEALDDAKTSLGAGRLHRAKMFAKLALSAGADPTEVETVMSAVRTELERHREPSATVAADDVHELVRRAKDHERKGEFESAVGLLAEAARTRPDLAPVHNQLGVVLAVRLKAFGRAVEHLLRATELEPNKPAYRNNLGKVLARAAGAGWRPADDAAPKIKELWSRWKRRMF